MCVTEYDEKRVLAQQLEDGIEIGREEGREEGIGIGLARGREEGRIETMKATAKKLFNRGWTVEEIAKFIEIPVVDAELWLNMN